MIKKIISTLLAVALTLSVVTVVAPAAKADTLPNYIKFEGTEKFTIKIGNGQYGKPDAAVNLQYSTDGINWNNYDDATRPSISSGNNKVVYFRGINNSFYDENLKDQWGYMPRWNNFVINPENGGTVAASGNIMALLNYQNPSTTLTEANMGAFFRLFNNCKSLTSAPALPATTLSDKCYQWMFSGCSSLETAPKLPATTLASECYLSMFAMCSSLEVVPELPATNLKEWCYASMFEGCTSLTKPPVLKATTLARSCYQAMFAGCTSLRMDETTDVTKALWIIPNSTNPQLWNDATLYNTAGPATSVELGKMYTDATVYPYRVGETYYSTASSLNSQIASGKIAENSTIVLTGEKPNGTIVLAGKDMTIDGSALSEIVLPDNGVLVKATKNAKVTVLGTIPITDEYYTADAPIYSEGFIYLGANAASKKELTTTGFVYQAKTAAEFRSASATVTEHISLTVSAEVAPKRDDVIAIDSKEGKAGSTKFNETTGYYESTISGIYLSHIGNKLGLKVKANDEAVETYEDFTTVEYLSAAANLAGTKDTMKTFIANLIIACKYINDVGSGSKGVAIDLQAEKLAWINDYKTTAAPVEKTMSIDTSDKNVRFVSAGIHVTDKLNLFVEIEPKGEGVEVVTPGTTVKAFIKIGSHYYKLNVVDSTVGTTILKDVNKKWFAYIDKLIPTQFDSEIKIELYNNDGELAQTLLYSVNTYCYKMCEKYPALCTAIYNYGTAALAVAAEQ